MLEDTSILKVKGTSAEEKVEQEQEDMVRLGEDSQIDGRKQEDKGGMGLEGS